MNDIESQLGEMKADKVYQEDALLHRQKQEIQRVSEVYEKNIEDLQEKITVGVSTIP